MNDLPQRRLGADGPSVSGVGLGCMSASWAYYLDRQDDSLSELALRRALELGVTHFDTATLYGRGHNETLVGRALRERQPEVLIASKCGLENRGFPRRKTVRDGRPETVRRQCDASLARLGSEYLDLYYLHRVDPKVPVEETFGALSELVVEGKIRRLGMSECTVDELARAHATHPVSALQSEFSLWTREPLQDVIPWCSANGVAFVAFGALGRGFLTGALPAGQSFPSRDFRARNPRFQPEAMSANMAIVDGLRRVGERLGATPAQLCVAWVLAQGEHMLPIPGTKRALYLEENLGGATLVLDAEALAELDALPPAVGARYG
ncbi:MAG TPA: aldo/keto reductase [Gaiellales bacterium]|nr:aldo/keto reductase [Gaiellales bacterium]